MDRFSATFSSSGCGSDHSSLLKIVVFHCLRAQYLEYILLHIKNILYKYSARQHRLRVRVQPEVSGPDPQLLQHPQVSLHLRHLLSGKYPRLKRVEHKRGGHV